MSTMDQITHKIFRSPCLYFHKIKKDNDESLHVIVGEKGNPT